MIKGCYGRNKKTSYVKCKVSTHKKGSELSSRDKFCIVHVNIASLNKDIDKLHDFLGTPDFKFPIIGLHEKIKIGTKKPVNNTDLPGYSFCYNKTESSHGRISFFASAKFHFKREVTDISLQIIHLSQLL